MGAGRVSREGRVCAPGRVRLLGTCQRRKFEGKPTHLALVELKKAYDTVPKRGAVPQNLLLWCARKDVAVHSGIVP